MSAAAKRLLTLRFDAGRSPRRRQSATGLPGDYLGPDFHRLTGYAITSR